VERLKFGRRVGVEGYAAGTAAVGIERKYRLAPVGPALIAIVAAVARGQVDPVGAAVVNDARPRPDCRSMIGARRARRHAREVNRPLTAHGVEDFLRTGTQIDGREVALVVAGVARVAAVEDVKKRRAVGRGGGERRRSFLVEALERRELRPAAARD